MGAAGSSTEMASGSDPGDQAAEVTVPEPAESAPDPHGGPEPITSVFRDSFDRDELGQDYLTTSSAWRLQGGRLCAERAQNHPIWLRRQLPTNARIEFEASSGSPDGDLKVEAWGDGRSAAQSNSYDHATSYLFILGGWKNTAHVLARLNEHDPGRQQIAVHPSGSDLRARRVRPHHPYHFKIERQDGRTVQWFVDDIRLFEFRDQQPLVGPDHSHFGFNDWSTPSCFDHLVITPL